MATRIWQGGAAAVTQLNTLTPTAANAQTYSVTINGKSISYVSDASATVAEITAGLLAAIQATDEPEFSEVTAADTGTTLTLEAVTAAAPFTQTSSATGGGALVTAVTTAAAGANHWSSATNWSGGAVPVSTDDVIIDNSSVSILYGLDQSAVALTSLMIGQGFTGHIGLAERNANGYDEYRETYLAIGSTTTTIGRPTATAAAGSQRIKLNTGSGGTTLTIHSTGNPIEADLEAVLWKGTGTNNVNVIRGSVGIAVLPGETASIATLRVGTGAAGQKAQVRSSGGVTLTTAVQSGGDLIIGNGATTITKLDGNLVVTGGAVTTLSNEGGTCLYQSSATVTTANVGSKGILDFRNDPRTRTVTTLNVDAGAKVYDTGRTTTFTNAIAISGKSLADVVLDISTNSSISFV